LIAIDYEICMSDVDTEGIVWRRPGDAGNDFVSPVIPEDSSVKCPALTFRSRDHR
jgi:hypothetical protein